MNWISWLLGVCRRNPQTAITAAALTILTWTLVAVPATRQGGEILVGAWILTPICMIITESMARSR